MKRSLGPLALRYGLAVCAVGVAYLARQGLVAWLGPDVPRFVTFYPAVMAAALLGGLGPGMLTTFLCALAAFLLIPRTGLFSEGSPAAVVVPVVFFAMGAFTSLLAHLYNRSQRKVAEYEKALALHDSQEALRESEETSRQRLLEIEGLYRNAPAGLCVLDREFRWIRINERLAAINGFPAAEHIGRRVRDLVPDLADVVEPELRAVLESGAPRLNVEVSGRTPAQPAVQRSWIMQVVPLEDADGGVIGLSVMVEETTERRQIEATLRASRAAALNLMEDAVEARGQAEETAAALCESEELLRLALEGARIGTFAFDFPTGQHTWTPELEALHGLGPGEFEGGRSDWERRIHPDDRAEVQRLVDLSIRTGEPTEGEWRVVWPDGSVHWLAGRWNVLKGAEGEPLRVTGINMDISARKEAEAALRENERRLAELMSNLPGMAYRCRMDREWTMLFVSDGCLELTGYRSSELEGNRCVAYAELIHPEDRDYVWSEVGKGVAEGRHFTMEYRIVTAGGSVKWVWERGGGVGGAPGQPEALEGFISDITAQKRAQDAVRRLNAELEKRVEARTAEFRASEEKFRTLAEESPNMILIERGGRLVYVNPLLQRVAGRAQEEMCSGEFELSELFAWPSVPRVASLFERCEEGAEVSSIEVVLARRGHASMNVLLAARSIDFGGGRAVMGIMTDFTARIAAERAVTRQREALRRLAARVASVQDAEQRRIAEGLHDGVAQLLVACGLKLAEMRTASARRKAQAIGEAERLLAEANKTIREMTFELWPATLSRVGLGNALEELCGTMRARFGVHFRFEGAGAPPVIADEAAAVLFKSARELMFNVVKHSGVSEAAVSLTVDARALEIMVQDAGRGFTVPGAPHNGAAPGQNLGLFSVAERMRTIGGRMKIVSNPGRGTRASLILPAAAPARPSRR